MTKNKIGNFTLQPSGNPTMFGGDASAEERLLETPALHLVEIISNDPEANEHQYRQDRREEGLVDVEDGEEVRVHLDNLD
jgi:hypothetical protein